MPAADGTHSKTATAGAAGGGLSRRQAMQAAACAALAVAATAPMSAVAVADSGPLMMAPPTAAQLPRGGRAPRGDTVRRIGRVSN